MQEHVKKTGKYIYFCPAGADIEKIQQELLNAIYGGDRSGVEFYKVISGKQTEAENRRNKEAFKNNKLSLKDLDRLEFPYTKEAK